MLALLEEIFQTGTIEIDATGARTKLHSNTSKEQGLFIQELFEDIKPQRTLEVGMALGISSLFILEMHDRQKSAEGSHLIIEPFPWGETAVHNFCKAGLFKYATILYKLSDEVLPELYQKKERIQLAYIDTTKLFDVVMQDFYFIDKILDIGGVVIIDDCDTTGINIVSRFIQGLDNYRAIGSFGESKFSWKRRMLERVVSAIVSMIPFKSIVYPIYSFKTSQQLNIQSRCLAFQKTGPDQRNWDKPQKI